jgi:hypothetical protein
MPFDYSELPNRDAALCSFSMGKDSIATYLEMRDHIENVVPIFLYGVPDLEFVEENLTYYEQKMGRHIIRLPQPNFYRMLNDLQYQPPDDARHAVMRAWQLPNHTHEDCRQWACEVDGLDPDVTYMGIGLKYADSIQRRTSLARNGLVTHSRRKFYPIAEYTKQDVLDKIKHAGWKLPSDYRYFKDSLDGFQIRYLYPIKKNFPRDYQRILEWFPLADCEILRYERSLKPKNVAVAKAQAVAKTATAQTAVY